MQIVFAIIPAAVYLAAGTNMMTHPVSIGTIVAFTALQVVIFRPIMGLLNMGAQWIASMALLSRIFGYLDLPIGVPAPENPVPIDRALIRGDVVFEDVHFSYPDGDEPVLDGVNVRIPAGGSLGVAGETGSGKSTLASLLIRLADPTQGRVTIDGIDVRDWQLEALRSQISIIEQEIFLFSRSILDNIRFGRPDASREEVIEAAKKAQAHDFIMSFPDGYDTIIGQRGVTLSGGQRQRLAIARAFVANPQILILDDSTSAIDSATEDRIQKAIWEAAKGRTTILITHRLSQIRWADHIVVMKRGRVVAQGTHEQLMQTSESYRRIFARDDDTPAEPPATRSLDETAHVTRQMED